MRKRSFAFNCQLHLVGGIAKHIADQEKGGIYWPLDPRLTIHVDAENGPSQIEDPQKY